MAAKITSYNELESAGDFGTVLRKLTIAELCEVWQEFSHGHVVDNRDGRKARCGGEALCKGCRAEGRIVSALKELQSEGE